MTSEEVVELLDEIETLYPNRFRDVDPVQRYHAFCRVLKKHDAALVMKNLYKHVEVSPHPPGVAELIRKPETSTVPNADQTKAYFEKYEYDEQSEESKRVMEEEKAKMRKILGI